MQLLIFYFTYWRYRFLSALYFFSIYIYIIFYTLLFLFCLLFLYIFQYLIYLFFVNLCENLLWEQSGFDQSDQKKEKEKKRKPLTPQHTFFNYLRPSFIATFFLCIGGVGGVSGTHHLPVKILNSTLLLATSHWTIALTHRWFHHASSYATCPLDGDSFSLTGPKLCKEWLNSREPEV